MNPRAGCHQRAIQMIEYLLSIGEKVHLLSIDKHEGYKWSDNDVQAAYDLGVSSVHLWPKAQSDSIVQWFRNLVYFIKPNIIWMNYARFCIVLLEFLLMSFWTFRIGVA